MKILPERNEVPEARNLLGQGVPENPADPVKIGP
jgi:hypothetical protein